MNDPRVEALTSHFLSYSDYDGQRGVAVCKCGHESPFNAWMDPDGDLDERVHVRHLLTAADQADREQGIHRVKSDDATVEKVAREMFNQRPGAEDQCGCSQPDIAYWIPRARAVLAALTGEQP